MRGTSRSAVDQTISWSMAQPAMASAAAIMCFIRSIAACRPLDTNRLANGGLTNRLVQAVLGQDIHPSSEQRLEFHLQSSEVQECPAWSQLHQEIHVAFGCFLATRNRPEYPYAIGAVRRSGRQDLRAKALEGIAKAHWLKISVAAAKLPRARLVDFTKGSPCSAMGSPNRP